MTSSVNVITAMIEGAAKAIEADQTDTLSDFLKQMPLSKLPAEDSDNLLLFFLTVAARLDRNNMAMIIFNAWQFVYPGRHETRQVGPATIVPSITPEGEIKIHQIPMNADIYHGEGKQISLITNLFVNHRFPVEILSFVINSFTVSFIDVITDLMEYDIGQMTYFGCRRALQVFGDQDIYIYTTLLQALGQQNYQIQRFLRNQIRRKSKYAPIPPWVKNFTPGSVPKESELQLPENPKLSFVIPPIEKMVALLTAGLVDSGLTPREREDSIFALREELQRLTESEKLEKLKPVVEYQIGDEQQVDIDIFRILGPANPRMHATPEEMKLGGERMFISTLYDFDEELGDVEDWFLGYCIQCDLRIRRRWHAVRIPDPRGGWAGCYCDWKCARKAELNSDNFNIATLLMIDLAENQVNQVSIQDRLPNNTKGLSTIQLETVESPEEKGKTPEEPTPVPSVILPQLTPTSLILPHLSPSSPLTPPAPSPVLTSAPSPVLTPVVIPAPSPVLTPVVIPAPSPVSTPVKTTGVPGVILPQITQISPPTSTLSSSISASPILPGSLPISQPMSPGRVFI